jgi:inosine-uridine nucleoside N-ribohydrolase
MTFGLCVSYCYSDFVDTLSIMPELTEAERNSVKLSGAENLIRCLEAHAEADVLLTGPITHLAYAVQSKPSIVDKINRVWWMVARFSFSFLLNEL